MEIQTGKLVSLQEVAAHVNSPNYYEDVVVFDGCTPFDGSQDIKHPIRLDALALVLCTSGGGKIGIDTKEYDIKPNTLIIIHPKNYIRTITSQKGGAANIIMCSRNIIEELIPKLSDLTPLLIQKRAEPVAQLSEDEAESLNTFYSFLKNKLNGRHTPFLKKKVLCVLQAILFEIMDLHVPEQTSEQNRKSRKQEIMTKFIFAISEDFRTERQVSYYADRLCITPKHLSAVVKEISGRTAGEWIEEYVTMEAKVLLKSTDLTIQEIASKLNFTNQSFFGKYFKHQTGYSPTEYRSLNV